MAPNATRTPFRPLDDLPLNRDTAQHFDAVVRLKPLQDMLVGQISQWMARNPKDRGEPPRIGLFGGLGQGKSSVVDLCLEELERERTARGKYRVLLRDWLLGAPVARFDVTHFKADDLEWRFLAAVLWRRIRHNLIWLLPLLAADFFVGFLFGRWIYESFLSTWLASWLWPILAALAGFPIWKSLLDAVKKVSDLDPGKGLYVAHRDWLMHEVARVTHALPSVVVVDDLDRAKVDQQRAFLRALLRFSRQMRFAVVVCLDESELLNANPDPESADELLRKVIQFELRLPERSREDAVGLALAVCRELADINPDWGFLLRHPRWLGDLVRCLLLYGPPGRLSPRLVKHLVNDVLLRADQLRLRNVGDCCALLRLDGLLRLAPGLRRHNGTLLRALESNRAAEFEATLAVVVAGEREAARRFFVRSRVMQPDSADGWFRLSAGLPLGQVGVHIGGTMGELRLLGRGYDYMRLFLAALEHLAVGYPARMDLYDDPAPDANAKRRLAFNIPGGGIEHFQAEDLPKELLTITPEFLALSWMMCVAVLTELDAPARQRLYQAADSWLEGLPADAVIKAHWADLLLREWLGDSEVWTMLPETERKRLVEAALDRGFSYLALVDLQPEEGVRALDALARCRARDIRRAAWWLANVKPPAITKLNPRTPSALAGTQLWPRIGGEAEAWPSRLLEHSGQLLPDGRDYILPATLAAVWRVWAAPWLSTSHCLSVLYAAARPERDEAWSLARMKGWLREDHSGLLPMGHMALPPNLLRLLGDDGLDWSAAGDLAPYHKLTALALAALCGWRLPATLVNGLSDVAPTSLPALLEAMLEPCEVPGGHCWLNMADLELIRALLMRCPTPDEATRIRWQRALLATLHQEAADDLFASLGWSPLLA